MYDNGNNLYYSYALRTVWLHYRNWEVSQACSSILMFQKYDVLTLEWRLKYMLCSTQILNYITVLYHFWYSGWKLKYVLCSTQISEYVNVSYDFWSPGWMLKDVFNNRSQCEGGNTAPRLWVRCRLSLQPLVCDKCNHWSQVSVLK